MQTTMQAAFAQADITPEYPVDLIGFGRADSTSRGILSRLYAQVLLLKTEKGVHCLIAADNIGLSVADAARLRQAVAGRTGASVEHVMVCCSHTHASPNTDEHALNGMRYTRALIDRVATCAAEAASRYTPALAGWGVTRAEIGENRRFGCTACDDRVGVLKISSAPTGKPLAAILRVTAHANVLVADNLRVSSDYFGAAREALEPALGCPVMITQGAAGNIKPKYQGEPGDLTTMAQALYRAVAPLSVEVRDADDLHMASFIKRYVSDVPDARETERIAGEAMRACDIDGSQWKLECERLRQADVLTQEKEMEISFLRIAGGCLCGIPSEIFVEPALEVMRNTSPLVFFGGYTNGFDGYLPGWEQWHQGGYETLYSYLQYYPYTGRVMPLRAETADAIAAFVAQKWREMADQ